MTSRPTAEPPTSDPTSGAPSGPPTTAGETTAERPWPVRLLSAKLTDYVSRAPVLWVEGQVVQLVRRPGQTTCYLTLRDPDVDLSFQVTTHVRVVDGFASGGVPLQDGTRVVAHVRPQLWPRRGSLSLAADQIRPVGVGELLARLEHLRRLLAEEGLFSADRKRPLPFLPRVVGLVCGRAGAAEHDVVENARRRWPAVRFDIRAVAVQGPNAVPDVVAAIIALDAEPEVDVIVVARGGGSLEDLLPFSNETLLRAVAECRTPLVSAIGHEVDSPLLDLVADVRASTPTDAGKRIVPDVTAERAAVDEARRRLRAALDARLGSEAATIAQLRARPALAEPERLLRERAEQAAALRERARRATSARLTHAVQDVAHLRDRVRALSPAATLERGYAVVRHADGRIVRAAAEVAAGDPIDVLVADGRFAAEVSGDPGPPRP